MQEDGSPLHWFNGVVWSAIFTNAFGGMIVATVMKYAGNILRNFAQALAIIVGGLGSWLLFDFQITMRFVLGVGLVIGSIFIYGSKVEQLEQWKSQMLGALGMGGGPSSYAMLPVNGAEEGGDTEAPETPQKRGSDLPPEPPSSKKSDD